MNKKDSTLTREDIRCETPQFKKNNGYLFSRA